MCLSSYWEEENLFSPSSYSPVCGQSTYLEPAGQKASHIFIPHTCQPVEEGDSNKRTWREVEGGQISNSKPGLLDFFFSQGKIQDVKEGPTFINLLITHKIHIAPGCFGPKMSNSHSLDLLDCIKEDLKHETVSVLTVCLGGNMCQGMLYLSSDRQGGPGRQAAGHTISFVPSQIPRIKIKSLHIPAQQQWRTCLPFSLSEKLYLALGFCIWCECFTCLLSPYLVSGTFRQECSLYLYQGALDNQLLYLLWIHTYTRVFWWDFLAAFVKNYKFPMSDWLFFVQTDIVTCPQWHCSALQWT